MYVFYLRYGVRMYVCYVFMYALSYACMCIYYGCMYVMYVCIVGAHLRISCECHVVARMCVMRVRMRVML